MYVWYCISYLPHSTEVKYVVVTCKTVPMN
jgi:hypothetical protein